MPRSRKVTPAGCRPRDQIDLHIERMNLNRVAVITGTTHGIGRVTGRELVKAGYTVVMLCRDLEAACSVRNEIAATVFWCGHPRDSL